MPTHSRLPSPQGQDPELSSSSQQQPTRQEPSESTTKEPQQHVPYTQFKQQVSYAAAIGTFPSGANRVSRNKYRLTMYTLASPPSKHSPFWHCRIANCSYHPSTSLRSGPFQSLEDWIRHALREHRGQIGFERKTVDTIVVYIPPAEEMFGGTKGKWRREGRIEMTLKVPYTQPTFQVQTQNHFQPQTVSQIQGLADDDLRETSLGCRKMASGSSVREHDGLRAPSHEWTYSQGRERDHPPTNPFDRSDNCQYHNSTSFLQSLLPSQPQLNSTKLESDTNVGPEDQSDTETIPDTEQEGSMDMLQCVCRRCSNTPPVPLDRLKTYGAFRILNLPAELRHAIYTIAISHAVRCQEVSVHGRWCFPALLHASSAIRHEAMTIYASTTHFDMPFKVFNGFVRLVGTSFTRFLRKVTLTFEDRVIKGSIFNFTEVFRLLSVTCPHVQLNLVSKDKEAQGFLSRLGTQWSQQGDHVVKLTEMLEKAKENIGAMRGLFEEPSTIKEIYAKGEGKIASITTTDKLWLGHEDLKAVFCVEETDELRVTVSGMPLRLTPLWLTMGAKTNRQGIIPNTEPQNSGIIKSGYSKDQKTFGEKVNDQRSGKPAFSGLVKSWANNSKEAKDFTSVENLGVGDHDGRFPKANSFAAIGKANIAGRMAGDDECVSNDSVAKCSEFDLATAFGDFGRPKVFEDLQWGEGGMRESSVTMQGDQEDDD